MNSEYFPTEFAIKLTRKVDLYPKKDIDDYDEFTTNKKKIEKRIIAIGQHEALSEFQELSISCDYDQALIAYHDFVLTEEQEEVLKKIHTSTPAWAKGKLVEKIMGHINASATSKDTKELSELLMGIIDNDLGDNQSTSAIEALIIKTTKRED